MKIFYSFSVVLAVLVFSGCGSSGGSSEGDAPVSSKSYIVSTGDGPQNISLSPAQAIIAEGSCTNTQIYGTDGASYGRNTNLAAGEYTVVFSEIFTKYSINSLETLLIQPARLGKRETFSLNPLTFCSEMI